MLSSSSSSSSPSSSSSRFSDEIEEVNESTPLLNENENNKNKNNDNKFILPWYKAPSIYFMLPAFLLVMIAFGLEVTTRVNFFVQIVCQNYYDSKSAKQLYLDKICDIPEIQAIASELMLILNLCSAIPGIFVLGFFGSLSDRKGRRLVFLLAIAGMGLNSLNAILVGNFWEYIGPNYLKYLMIGSLFDGFLGGILSLFAASHAYAADCSTPAQRSIAFGWVQGAILIGVSFGPIISGLIVEKTNNILSVFYISFTLYAIFFLFVLFILPESISFDKQLKNQQKSSGLLNIFSQLSIFLPKDLTTNRLRQRRQQREGREEEEEEVVLNAGRYSSLILAGTYFMLILSIVGVESIIVLYTSYVFKWSLIEQGYYRLFMGILKVGILALFPAITKFMKKRIFDEKSNNNNNDNNDNNDNNNNDVNNNNKLMIIDNKKEKNGLLYDIWVIRFSLVMDGVAYFIYGLATNSMEFVSGVFICSLGITAYSTIKSLQTNLIPSSQVGQLLGALSVLESIARVIAPVIFNSLYSFLVVTATPNFVWYAISGMLFFGVFLMFLIVPKK